MTFTDKLAKLSLDIRHRATGREFEEECYSVRWDGPDEMTHNPHPMGVPTKVLTVARYGRGPIPNDVDDANYNYYVYPGIAVWNQKFATFDWVDDALMAYGKSHPTSLETLIDSLKDIPNLLCAESEWMDLEGEDTLKRLEDRIQTGTDRDILLENGIAELGNWSGETASVYYTTFGSNGNKWTDIVQRNYYLAELLVSSAEAQLAVFVTARESIMSIAEETGNALWSLHDSRGGGWDTMFTILGAIVVTALSGGTAAAVVGAGITITRALVAEAESGDVDKRDVKDTRTISGDTVSDVLASMISAVNALHTEMIEKQHEIHSVLRGAYNSAVAALPEYQITIDKDTAPLSRSSMGQRNVEGQTNLLKAAATKAFPDAAEPMLTINAALAQSGGAQEEFTAETYGGVTSVHSAWTDLRDLLQDLTGANGDAVKRAGEVLLDYAVDLDKVDEESAQAIEKTYQRDSEYSGTDHEVHVPPPETRRPTGY